MILQDDVNIDQSTLQYYIILALQDFYFNYHLPLVEGNKGLKDKMNEMKKKNDKRFNIIKDNLEIMAKHINNIKK